MSPPDPAPNWRHEGVLVIGSGFMTHGLPYHTREMVTGGSVPAWSSDFDGWATDALSRGDVAALTDYRHARSRWRSTAT